MLIGSTSILSAATGTLSGRVVSKQAEPLPGANVIVSRKIENNKETDLKTKIGTASDIDGYYVISGIAPGTYIIEVSYIGYKTKEIKVKISSGETTNRDIKLENFSVKGEEVVVSAQAKGQMDAINRQINAENIKNIVATDRIQENPDANAAEAVGRLPGVSVVRSGGEAQDFMIRGLPSKYNKVQLNGVEIPSNKSGGRSASVSGVSQYALQGIELSKSITPDMEAGAVSGVVNMELKEAPKGFNSQIMIQPGYNDQNNYWNNYTINGNISNRYLDSKLGVNFNLTASRTNRSTQKMSAEYGIESYKADSLYLNSAELTDVDNIKDKQSGSLVMDYRYSSDSKIKLSGFYSSNNDSRTDVSKLYVMTAGQYDVVYDVSQPKDNYSELLLTNLEGKQFIKSLKIDYGISYSKSEVSNPDIRSWMISNSTAYDHITKTRELRSQHPSDIINYAKDDASSQNLKNFWIDRISYSKHYMEESHFDGKIDLKYPFQLGNSYSGFIKAGGKYKYKDRKQNNDSYHRWVTSGHQTNFSDDAEEEFDWAVQNKHGDLTMVNINDYSLGKFLQGGFDYGWYPDVDRLNTLFDWWKDISQEKIAENKNNTASYGFRIDRGSSAMNDQDLSEEYWAGYIMSEMKFQDLIIFTPGFRYEEVKNELIGKEVKRVPFPSQLNATDTSGIRENSYLLPMINLKLKPTNWNNILFAYSQTLHRPNFNAISPNIHYSDLDDWYYHSGNPDLKPELWTNYDLRLSFFNDKLGLFVINGFYKNVKNKIWNRSWTRLKGDDPVPHFEEDAQVRIATWLNQDYDVYVRGFETEWQTNLWYLPSPLNYFTLNLNYTFTDNETKYPYTTVSKIPVDTTNRGRVIWEQIRIDSTYSGPMLNQPRHIVNMSLGFNYKGFSSWLSLQYKGKILRSKKEIEELDILKNKFYRLDLQIKQELPIEGMGLLFSLSNINDFQEKTIYRGDWRPASLENYGWTADFGLRYSF